MLLALTGIGHAQIRISGFIKDEKSNERLIGATVFDTLSKKGAVSDKQGFFSIVAGTPAIIRISFIGYTSTTIPVQAKTDTLIEVMLSPGQSLPTVEISAGYQPRFNTAVLTTKEIMNIPSLTGKPDVLKAMQLLPGIRSQGELSSVTLVRGGNPGENLYLIDQTPLIYVHHIGGFMSVFNPDMINDVEMYKGSFPAKYGERLSSVVNISQKEGDQSGFQGSFGIGLSDISLTLEGPTGLKNSSFIFTGRKTLFTDLFYLISSSTSSFSGARMMYGFHDVNGKFSWMPNKNNSFHFNLYQGDDYLQLWSKPIFGEEDVKFHNGNIWGNWLASANWKHVFSSKLFLNNTFSFTHYRLKNSEKMTSENSYESNKKATSGMQNLSLCSDAKYALLKNWDMDFGFKASWLLFKPMEIQDMKDGKTGERTNSLESALYVDNHIQVMKQVSADIGFRLVNYINASFYHFSPEPRLSFNYFFKQNTFNASYMRVSQNAQLIYNTGSISANEIYIPSGEEIPVSFSDQVSCGWNSHFYQHMFETEINVYYKTLENLSTYKEGFNYAIGDIYWKDKIETGGHGESKGIEFIIKKTKGKWTGFAGYTWSESTRQFPHVNQGQTYPFEYDAPHSVSLSVTYQLSKKWSLNAAWQLQSGLPYTPINGRYLTVDIDENGDYTPYEALIYGDKNSARMAPYHRLDIAFKYAKITKRRNRKAELTLGLFNAYNHQNPYYYYYNSNASGEIYDPRTWGEFRPLKLYQVSMFPIMPIIAYKVWFGANSGQTPKPPKRSFKQWLMYE